MVDQGITAKFDEIYNSTYKSVVSLVTARCNNTADISDIVQDTYMELYQLLNKRGIGYIQNDKAITLKIAKRKLSRYYSLAQRLKVFIPLVTANESGDEVTLSDFEADSFHGFNTEDFAINKAVMEEVRKVISEKPAKVKKIFHLFYDVDLSIAEIAKTLCISESDVKNKLYRTIKELRELLQ